MLYFPKVYVQSDNNRFANALRGYLRGQWVNVNGMTGRIVNHTVDCVVVMLVDRLAKPGDNIVVYR